MSEDGVEESPSSEPEKRLVFAETRTVDVVTTKTFEELLIDPVIIARLKKADFLQPTPIQAGAIPLGLLGNDVLVQAKSGTGKTLVFATIIATHLMETNTRGKPIAVVVASTRDIARQIRDTVVKVTSKKIRTYVFVGGEPIADNVSALNRGCDVVIGTPGRLAQLMRDKVATFDYSRLFVLDEADMLVSGDFTDDIRAVYNCLNPQTTQVTAFSATYPPELETILCDFMKTPTLVKLNADDVQLCGIYQYAVIADKENYIKTLTDLLKRLSYRQVIIFTNSVNSCHKVCKALVADGYSAEAISRDLTQKQRNQVISNLKDHTLKVLVSTDLTARGIDSVHVDVVINIGVPRDQETYLHRAGRAGRYGGTGAAFTLMVDRSDRLQMARMARKATLRLKRLDMATDFPPDLPSNDEYHGNCLQFLDDKGLAETSSSPVSNTTESLEDYMMTETAAIPTRAEILEARKAAETLQAQYLKEKMAALKIDGGDASETVQKQPSTCAESQNDFNSLSNRKTESVKRDSVDFPRTNSTSIFNGPACKSESASNTQTDQVLSDKLQNLKAKKFGRDVGFGSASGFSFGKTNPFRSNSNGQSPSTSVVPTKAESASMPTAKYTNEELKAVEDSRSIDEWREYALKRSGWQIDQEPFEFDQSLRCDFATQLRILREREKIILRAIRMQASQNATANTPDPYVVMLDGGKVSEPCDVVEEAPSNDSNSNSGDEIVEPMDTGAPYESTFYFEYAKLLTSKIPAILSRLP